jgi:cytochrome c553
MRINARILRSVLPALVGAGLMLAACSSDSDDAKGPDNTPSDGGSESGGGSDSNGGMAGAPAEQPEAGAPSGGTGGTGGTGGSGGSSVGGDPDPGAGGTPPEPGVAGAGGAGGEATVPSGPTEGFLRGEKLAKDKTCATCHQADFGGVGLWPNITPDKATGIGEWTDEQIGDAIRNGKDPEGGNLCAQMQKYPLTDDELADLIEYLRGIPAVSRKLNDLCQ